MVSGSPIGEPAFDLTTQHSVACPPLSAAVVRRRLNRHLLAVFVLSTDHTRVRVG
jgi:hypothetical protein